MARQTGSAGFGFELQMDAQSQRITDVNYEPDFGNKVINVIDRITAVEWCESLLGGGLSVRINVDDADWYFWSELLAGNEGTKLQGRLLLFQENEQITGPWRTLLLDSPQSVVSTQSLRGVLPCGDRRLALQQVTRYVAHTSKTITDIVQSIAQRYALTADIAPLDDVPKDRWQAGLSDWDYMQEMLLPDCSAGGRGDLYLWIEENTLHLKPLDFSVQPVRAYAIGVDDARTISAQLTMSNRHADRQGAATVKAVGFDLDTKQGVTFNVTNAAAGRSPSLSDKLPRKRSEGILYLPSAAPTLNEIQRRALRRWGQQSSMYGQMKLNLQSDLSLLPGQMVSVTLQGNDDQTFFASGIYPVLEVRHYFSLSTQRTELTLMRREMQKGVEDAVGVRVGGKPVDAYQQGGSSEAPKIVVVKAL